jgi:hypothetical protein
MTLAFSFELAPGKNELKKGRWGGSGRDIVGRREGGRGREKT